MSFFKKLFGGGGSDGDSDGGGGKSAAQAVEHEGYAIVPTPMKEGAQFRLAGTISREVDGEIKTHDLIRADLFTSADECAEACIRKAKQVIKEQGHSIFK